MSLGNPLVEGDVMSGDPRDNGFHSCQVVPCKVVGGSDVETVPQDLSWASDGGVSTGKLSL